MKLNNENIEEYILLLADNELNKAEELEVMAFIEQHAGYKSMLDAYLASRLDPDDDFVFPDKESLLQPEPVVLPFRRKNLSPLKWAAAVVVLIGLSVAGALIFSNEEIKKEQNLVLTSKETTKSVPLQAIPIVHVDSVLLAKVEKEKPATKIPHQQFNKAIAQTNRQIVATANVAMPPKQTVPVLLEAAGTNKIPIAVVIEPKAIVMEQIQEQTEATEKKLLPTWLPVNEENLQGVNSLIAHIQILKENIQERTKSLKNTAFVINIGNRQISIGK